MPQRAYVDLPIVIVSTSRGMRKYSTVRASAGEPRGRAHLAPGERAEALAEPGQGALEDRFDGLGRDVARRHPGAAGEHDRVHVGAREEPAERRADARDVVADPGARDHA